MSWTCKLGPKAQRDSEALEFDLLQIQLIFIPNSWILKRKLAQDQNILSGMRCEKIIQPGSFLSIFRDLLSIRSIEYCFAALLYLDYMLAKHFFCLLECIFL